MTPAESNLMRGHAAFDRRRAILECFVGIALLLVTIICGLRGEIWHAIGSALAAGGTLSASVFTYVRGRQWMRVAKKREGGR